MTDDNKQLEYRTPDDEIDLKELFITLWNKRLFIVLFTAFVSFFSLVYVFLKNPIPIYSGSLLIEIGEYYSNEFGTEYFDKTGNLKVLIEKENNVNVTFPRRSDKLLLISSSNANKDNIRKNILKTLSIIIKRHEDKSKLYNKFIMTKQIGKISISNIAINTPKKKLIVIVSFLTGFILSIFLVFFLNFINSFGEEKKAL